MGNESGVSPPSLEGKRLKRIPEKENPEQSKKTVSKVSKAKSKEVRIILATGRLKDKFKTSYVYVYI